MKPILDLTPEGILQALVDANLEQQRAQALRASRNRRVGQYRRGHA
jgi:hypothetical protein